MYPQRCTVVAIRKTKPSSPLPGTPRPPRPSSLAPPPPRPRSRPERARLPDWTLCEFLTRGGPTEWTEFTQKGTYASSQGMRKKLYDCAAICDACM